MNIRFYSIIITAVMMCCGFPAYTAEYSKKTTLLEVIHNVLEHYPTISIARKQIEQSLKEIDKVQSRLGWNLNAIGGIEHNLSVFDIPTDTASVSASLQRKLENGHSVEINAKYSHDDADAVIFPGQSNPVDRGELGAKYRMPLGRGENNTSYKEDIVRSQVNNKIQIATRSREINALVSTIVSLYYSIALLEEQSNEALLAIERAKKMLRFVQRNKNLGLSDNSDLLQAQAQLYEQEVQYQHTKTLWDTQVRELNRLMGSPADNAIVPVVEMFPVEYNREQIYSEVMAHSPDIHLAIAQQQLATADIHQATDEKRDQLDLIVAAGVKTSSTSSFTAAASQEEVIGGVQLEYRYAFDKKGFDANLYQAHSRNATAQEEIMRIKQDLKYQVDSSIEQLNSRNKTIIQSKEHADINAKILAEMSARYKDGRITIRDLIGYERSYQQSLLMYAQDRIQNAREASLLDLSRGQLWNNSLLIPELP